MTWIPIPEMLWRPDIAITAARKRPEWAAFHRACGNLGLYFDHCQRVGRSGFSVDAFTTRNGVAVLLANGRGKSPAEAVAAAYGAQAIRTTDDVLAALLRTDAATDADLEALLGGAALTTDLEDLLG